MIGRAGRENIWLEVRPDFIQSISIFYYMANSASGQDEPTARCDWLPERARWSHLTRSGLPAASHRQNFTKSHIINPLLTKFVRSRWLDIGLVRFFASSWTSTSSRSINTQKKNLANIQPSWPHTWSITHTSCMTTYCRKFWPKTLSFISSRRTRNSQFIENTTHVLIFVYAKKPTESWHTCKAVKNMSKPSKTYN